ncbi:MAG: SDR family NAD(P)-dependent oxidoreductase [Saprospiraceae bacterium]|nr:SDR family NAD(P)-dependent oxidoreductase [Saprospiraceae bacterium]MBP7923475.1 SDR family NAD(P)-dependent oxidoreductase [Saprospiraceae bacterium]MBP9744253.1 SDR family NAD(P)-dependent oxidoreductase [Saprospiraceae bacterium]
MINIDLSHKLALVTGCNRGIGMSMAIGLAEAGADIIGVSARLDLQDSLIALEIKALGRKFYPYQADFTLCTSLYSFIHQCKSDHPVIDILVNNAGTILRKPSAEHRDDYWDQVIEVNLNAQFVLAREIGSDMIARGKGKIIFTASLLTFQGGINVPGYAASKGAIGSLIKALANEWAGKGDNVNGIAPGYVATDHTEALRVDPARSAAILARILASSWGHPDDFKGPVVFLASELSSYVHGTILTVDGGWMGR